MPVGDVVEHDRGPLASDRGDGAVEPARAVGGRLVGALRLARADGPVPLVEPRRLERRGELGQSAAGERGHAEQRGGGRVGLEEPEVDGSVAVTDQLRFEVALPGEGGVSGIRRIDRHGGHCACLRVCGRRNLRDKGNPVKRARAYSSWWRT